MTTRDRIILESKAWVLEKLKLDKQYFNRLQRPHHPEVLWIGSADSLVPVREITNTEPGEIIVYENLGNIVSSEDESLLAVLEDAIEIERVDNIIVCGYSHCSSIRHVLHGTKLPRVRTWLAELFELYDLNRAELDALNEEQRAIRLTELNIIRQVENLSKLSIVQKACAEHSCPNIYGWLFNMHTGEFKEVINLGKKKEVLV